VLAGKQNHKTLSLAFAKTNRTPSLLVAPVARANLTLAQKKSPGWATSRDITGIVCGTGAEFALFSLLHVASWDTCRGHMPKKKRKPKKFRAVEAVKALARERIGTPPAGQVIRDRKKKEKIAEKYKPTLGEILNAD
jgi:hypothetical protein